MLYVDIRPLDLANPPNPIHWWWEERIGGARAQYRRGEASLFRKKKKNQLELRFVLRELNSNGIPTKNQDHFYIYCGFLPMSVPM